jgi:hypothetical protein
MSSPSLFLMPGGSYPALLLLPSLLLGVGGCAGDVVVLSGGPDDLALFEVTIGNDLWAGGNNATTFGVSPYLVDGELAAGR